MALARKKKDLPFLPVSRETVQDHVYRRMRELILNGDISPGERSPFKACRIRLGSAPCRCAKHCIG